jgi:hypothetical protein
LAGLFCASCPKSPSAVKAAIRLAEDGIALTLYFDATATRLMRILPDMPHLHHTRCGAADFLFDFIAAFVVK